MTLARYAVLAVPVLGLIEAVAHVVFSRSPPELEEWREARSLVGELKEPGDLLVVAPRWAEPNARWALGDPIMTLRDVARPDESGYPRAVELSILGEQAPELRGWNVVSENSRGKFRARVLENPSHDQVLFDFTDHVDPRHASAFEVKGSEAACVWKDNLKSKSGGLGGHPTFPRARFDCPGGEFFFVGVTVIDDHEYKPRRCIWAHPVSGGRLRIRYERVRLGAVIRGYGGMPWLLERSKSGAPVQMNVLVDGRSIGSYEHVDGDGWKPFEFATGAADKEATVDFETSSANVAHRHFCFHADTR